MLVRIPMDKQKNARNATKTTSDYKSLSRKWLKKHSRNVVYD